MSEEIGSQQHEYPETLTPQGDVSSKIYIITSCNTILNCLLRNSHNLLYKLVLGGKLGRNN